MLYRILDLVQAFFYADQDCLDVPKSVSLEENDGLTLKLTVPTGFLPSFQGSEAEKGCSIESLTWHRNS